MLDNGSLRISNVTKLDGGLYTCVARNQYGMGSSAGTLVVKGTVIASQLWLENEAKLSLRFRIFFSIRAVYEVWSNPPITPVCVCV